MAKQVVRDGKTYINKTGSEQRTPADRAATKAAIGSGEAGTVYILHFVDAETRESKRFKHVGHYIGWASGGEEGVEKRLASHRSGRGGRLMAAVMAAGLDFEVVSLIPGVDRHYERWLKDRNGTAKLCVRCRAEAKAAKEVA